MKPCACAAALLLFLATSAGAQLPARDLSVELRQIEEGSTGGYSVGTQPQSPLMTPQQMLVRNGSKASFSLGQSIPVQWVQSASSNTATLSVTATGTGSGSGADASSRGGSVTQALIWMDAGQSLVVKPRWPGGRQPVTVEVEMQAANLEARPGAELPTQARSQLVTTVGTPLDQWVTIAATGRRQARGTYGSEGAAEGRRLLQLRISLP